ncbi:MAG: thiamine pyrophosphate-binding protein [Candidatus Latescibacteria bacterium]|nr:thiamine pyrophosphate-binding protein [Candidatus Latescibacterota bacterium]
MSSEYTCSDAIAEALHESQVTHIFGQPGGEVVELMESLHSHDVTFVLTGHESAAAFMAGTVGRMTGIPGACLATLGPGACNLVLGVASAYLDRDPLLAISARTATSRARISNKQNLDLNALFEPVTKWSVVLDGMGTKQSVHDAIDVATATPKGPVYLSVASDMATVADRPDMPGPSPPILPASTAASFDTIAKALNSSSRPVGVIGLAMDAIRDTPSVRRFFEETGIPYVITCQGKGIGDPGGQRFLGYVLPAAGDMHIAEWIATSDCILGVGFDPVESSKNWHFDTPFYSIANGPVGFDEFQPTAECTGDVSVLIDQLSVEYRGKTVWQDSAVRDLRSRVNGAITPDSEATAKGLSPFHLISFLNDLLPANTIVSGDVGAHKNVLGQAWDASHPNTFLMSNGLSSMGHGPASAIAASMIFPESPVISITGDGAFAMMVQELETVRRLGTAPLFIVLCDASLSIIKFAQNLRNLPNRGVDFLPVDWARVAEGFGVRGETAGDLQGVRDTVEKWLANREPLVLAVPIDESLYIGLRY